MDVDVEAVGGAGVRTLDQQIASDLRAELQQDLPDLRTRYVPADR
jgi:hypothetical protein